jgi:Tfp pilus assembly pilus retraction ATPase PilT
MAVDYKKELQLLIDILLEEKASDMHFSVGSHPLIRVSGTLIPLVKKPILTNTDVDAFSTGFNAT